MARPEDSWRGKVRGMTSDEVEDFLKQGINMYLACLDQDGDPYITVCWHEWRDGHFWVIPRQRSRWAEYLVADPRVSFVIEQSKTLKCNECGGLNYPTEWYCERCGAELAAL